MRGSACIPPPRWIQTKRGDVDVTGTGDDCFKWAILAGMHLGKYDEHMGKYEFSSLSFPTSLQSVGPFGHRNNMSINVYGVDDDKEVIYSPPRLIHTRTR